MGPSPSPARPSRRREQNVIANSRRLLGECRKRGVMICRVWFVCEPGHPALSSKELLFQRLKAACGLVRGTWGVEPAPGLEARDGDLVVEKMSMSAWETSRLESYLRHAGIDTIINTGAWKRIPIEYTARTGGDKGFRIIVPQDACSTMNADWHRASLNYAMANVAEVTSVDAVVRGLSGH